MFYLNTWFKSTKKSPVKLFAFFAMGILLVVAFAQKHRLEKQLFKSLVKTQSGPYFYALVSSKQNYEGVSRKLLGLPGVEKVKVLSEDIVREETKKILGNTDLEIGSSLLDLNYAGLKIVFNEKLQARSQNLIRDYLVRLVGKSNLTLGAVKTSDDIDAKKKFLIMFLSNWGVPLALGFMAILWMLLGASLSHDVNTRAWLIQQYQRKENVAFKSACVGLTVIYLTGLGISFAFGQPLWIWMIASVVPFVFVGSLHVSNKEWQN